MLVSSGARDRRARSLLGIAASRSRRIVFKRRRDAVRFAVY